MATVHSSRLTALAALAALLVPAAAVAQDARLPSSNSRPASVSAGAVLLLDAYGRPLFAKNADDERAPASLAKLMTLYLANEDIERGKAELDEPVQISHYAAPTPHLAQLTIRLLQDYPASRTMLGGQTFVYNGRVYARHIPLFNDPWGVQALKTGFTQEAGYNLAASAWRGGQQFVMILLGARTRTSSFLDAKKLLHYAFVEAGLDPPDERSHPGPRQPGRARRAAAAR